MESQECRLLPSSDGDEDIISTGEKNRKGQIGEAQDTGTIADVRCHLISFSCIPCVRPDIVIAGAAEANVEDDI